VKSTQQWLRELVELFDQGVSAQGLLNHALQWAGQLAEQGKAPDEARTAVLEACDGPAAEALEKALGTVQLRRRWLAWNGRTHRRDSNEEEAP
jgi:hypothetical protein